MDKTLGRDLLAIPRALVQPDRVAAGQQLYRVPKSILFIFLFLLYLIGARLAAGYNQNAHAKELALLEADSRMGGFMANAPPEDQAKARDNMVNSILGQRSGLITAVGIVFSSLLFLVLVMEMWLVCTVVTQFFGGQEERHGRDRPSLALFLVGFLPLALRKLLAGIVLAFQNPDVAANALTLTDYRAVSAVRFDLFSLLAPQGVHPALAAVAGLVSDPFFLWTFVIVTLGSREVFRVPLKSAIGQSVILVALLSLQLILFKSIGLNWEI